MPHETPIKVAAILNDRELALNAGTARGLEPGTVLRVVNGRPHEVVDPDTGKVLGKIMTTKAVVRVYEAQGSYALARTFRTRRVNIGGQGIAAVDRLFSSPKYETRVETLRRSPNVGEPISPDESIVAVGDIVEIVDDDTAKDLPTSTVWR